MAFIALLTKELRSRLRSERTAWLLVIYVLILGLIGALVVVIASGSNSSGPGAFGSNLSTAGLTLYILLTLLQLFLVVFTTPAFTATAINGEKERQTFDMLMSSSLTGVALNGGKLVAGLVNTLLLIAASIPLFSLVFFFGGVSPLQFFGALVVYITTAFVVGAISLFFSTILRRPAASTAVAYLVGLIWLLGPLFITYIYIAVNRSYSFGNQYWQVISVFNPLLAMYTTYPSQVASNTLALGFMPNWLAYALVVSLIGLIFFVLSARIVRSGSRVLRFPQPEGGSGVGGDVVVHESLHM